jgi:hypothetical protein
MKKGTVCQERYTTSVGVSYLSIREPALQEEGH